MEGAGFTCPHCGGALEATLSDQPQTVDCPHCLRPILLPADESLQESPPDRDDELDGLRIRRVAQMHNAAYRTRSYCLVAAFACLGIALQLTWLAVGQLRAAGWTWRAITYLLLAVACALLVPFFLVRAGRAQRQARQSGLTEPPRPPDFVPLGSRAEPWKDLEKMQ